MSRPRPHVRSPFVLKKPPYERLRLGSEALPASCWCERHIVRVSPTDVQAGRTASCGHPVCHAPRVASER